MRITFTEPRDGCPEKLVAEVELHFEDGLLEGMKLVGISLWKNAEGEKYVTLPARSFGAGRDRRYFDYLRASGNDHNVKAKALKEYVLAKYIESKSSPQS